jgi:hypothetical protein
LLAQYLQRWPGTASIGLGKKATQEQTAIDRALADWLFFAYLDAEKIGQFEDPST